MRGGEYGSQGEIKSNEKRKKRGESGFEDKLWAAADKLCGNMDAAEYKHVVLGLIFLKYISDAFLEKHNWLMEESSNQRANTSSGNRRFATALPKIATSI